MDLSLEQFFTNGYTLIEDFIPLDIVEQLKAECDRLVRQFDPFDGTIFTTGVNQTVNDYFLHSNDKIRYFLEKNAIVNHQLTVPKEMCLNKIGHALHWHSDVFKRFTFDQRFKSLIEALNFVDPVVVQSMVIFKNPSIGTEVPAHQDASYLHATPDPKVVGFWIPLEDALEVNGCLEFVPGSHKNEPLKTQWIRQQQTDQEGKCHIQMEHTNSEHKFDGNFVSQEAKKGSCVLIDGLVVHRSKANNSKYPRPVYTFHVFDQANRQWDPLNWLQPSESLPFPSLLNTKNLNSIQ